MKSYVLMFSEIANSLGEEPGPVFNRTSNITNDENVLLSVDDGVSSGIQYDVTIFAFNMAGSSEFTITVCKYSSMQHRKSCSFCRLFRHYRIAVQYGGDQFHLC